MKTVTPASPPIRLNSLPDATSHNMSSPAPFPPEAAAQIGHQAKMPANGHCRLSFKILDLAGRYPHPTHTSKALSLPLESTERSAIGEEASAEISPVCATEVTGRPVIASLSLNFAHSAQPICSLKVLSSCRHPVPQLQCAVSAHPILDHPAIAGDQKMAIGGNGRRIDLG